MKPYKFSFVAGGLLYPETLAITRRYFEQEQKDWDAIRKEIIKGELLHTTRITSRLRYYLEIKRRLSVAHPFEIEWIAQEQEEYKLVCFAICCRYYEFLADFVREVVLEKMRIPNSILTDSDFYSFLQKKTESNIQLGKLKNTTRIKIQTVIYRMLKEADILDPRTKQLNKPYIPATLIEKYIHITDQVSLIYLGMKEGLFI
jgi:hypothetical protein